MKRYIKLLVLIIMMLMSICFSGCRAEKLDTNKIKDIEFTAVEDAEVPKELAKIIKEKKEKPFKITYSDKENLYIAEGFGEQISGGYSIAVDKLYLTENAICIHNNLIGPSKQDLVTREVTYPYIVVKIEFMDKTVMFN